MEIKIKLDKSASLPVYSSIDAAGMDMVATTINTNENYIEYGTGVYLEIPKGYVGLLFPRSSISKKALTLANSVGVIDSDYRGEIKFRFKFNDDKITKVMSSSIYDSGDKIGQLMIIPYPKVEFKQVESLEETERGEGGFGSTDVK